MDPVNAFTASYEYDEHDPDGFKSGIALVGRLAGGRTNAVKAYELPPGQSLCPYHYEYEEEWLLVLEGTAELRSPEGERELERGDLVCFPPGPEGAHKVTGRGDQPARVLMFSRDLEPAVAVYPDSGKIGVWPGNHDDDLMIKRPDNNLDYWDGER
jgi:uncharacterized cupin superfamily protein